MDLPLGIRMAWQFITCNSDHAGFFDVSTHKLMLEAVSETKIEAIESALGMRIQALTPHLWQVRGFFIEQFPRDYEAKLNGVQTRALQLIRRYASLFGEVVFSIAFNGLPAWPELKLPPKDSLTSPAERNDNPCPLPGSTPGGPLPGSTPGGPLPGSTGRAGKGGEGHGGACPSLNPPPKESGVVQKQNSAKENLKVCQHLWEDSPAVAMASLGFSPDTLDSYRDLQICGLCGAHRPKKPPS